MDSDVVVIKHLQSKSFRLPTWSVCFGLSVGLPGGCNWGNRLGCIESVCGLSHGLWVFPGGAEWPAVSCKRHSGQNQRPEPEESDSTARPGGDTTVSRITFSVILLYYIILVFATVLNFVLMLFCCCSPQQERQNSSHLHPLTEMTKSLLKNITNTYLMLEDVKRVSFKPFPLPRNS